MVATFRATVAADFVRRNGYALAPDRPREHAETGTLAPKIARRN